VKVYHKQEQILRLRRKVDKIDEKLARLLASRERTVLRISQAKIGVSEIVDRKREQVVIGNFSEYAGKYGLSPEIADPVIREVVKQCTIVQHNAIVSQSETDAASHD
jgi:chorismate mutase